jgi:hypothetical protein
MTYRWGVGEELISAMVAVVGQGYRAATGSVSRAPTLLVAPGLFCREVAAVGLGAAASAASAPPGGDGDESGARRRWHHRERSPAPPCSPL